MYVCMYVCEYIFMNVCDVAQNIAQELIFYCYGQILIGGPLKAFWALGESRGPDTSVKKSPWDQKYLWHALETTNIFLERPNKA